MTFSTRLALLRLRSAISVSIGRCLGSSYGLIDHRPFPYRQISEFTKNSQMGTLEDPNISMELKSEEDRDNAYREETERLRAEVEKMRTERAKAGKFCPTLWPYPSYVPLDQSKESKMMYERKEVEKWHDDLVVMNLSDRVFDERLKSWDESTQHISKGIQEMTEDMKDFGRDLAMLGRLTAIVSPMLILFIALY